MGVDVPAAAECGQVNDGSRLRNNFLERLKPLCRSQPISGLKPRPLKTAAGGSYFVGTTGGVAGATDDAASGAASAAFTAGEILSALASSWLTCQSWKSVRRPLKPGMPVRRMPFVAFQ